jgi:hypothetical protein
LNLSLHKELYFFEWQRKEKLESSANLPVALLTALAGGTLFLFRTFTYSGNLSTVLFLVLAGGGVASLVTGMYFLVRSLYGFWYEQIPSPDKLQAYFEELLQYHASTNGSDESAQRDFDEYLQTRLAEATAVNRSNNTRTAGALHKASGSIVFALIFAGISFLPYVAESFGGSVCTAKIQNQTVLKIPSETQMADHQQQTPEQPQQRPQQQQPVTQPPKPQGPPNEQVRKGGETREKR